MILVQGHLGNRLISELRCHFFHDFVLLYIVVHVVASSSAALLILMGKAWERGYYSSIAHAGVGQCIKKVLFEQGIY